MEERRFDQVARALGGASTRRSALAALAALLAGGAAIDADAKRHDHGRGPGAAGRRRSRRCNPACPTGQTCTKGTCTCDNGGEVCVDACCTGGQQCDGGACVDPPPTCHALEESCGDGTPCCDGLQCGSGYGGGPVACWPVPGGTCEVDQDCSYGSHCADGECVVDPPPPPPPPCVPTVPVTGNPGANGAALRAAVAAAADGATIVLAAGEYRFDVGAGWIYGGLEIVDKHLTIEGCGAGGVVKLVCPSSASNPQCVSILTFTGASASLALTGLTLRDERPAAQSVFLVSPYGPSQPATAVLEDVALETASGVTMGINAWGAVTVKKGVTITAGGAQVSSFGYALSTVGASGSITCEVPPTMVGFTTPCNPFSNITDCGCP